jgi:hypothetical protein
MWLSLTFQLIILLFLLLHRQLLALCLQESHVAAICLLNVAAILLVLSEFVFIPDDESIYDLQSDGGAGEESVIDMVETEAEGQA